MMNGQTEESNKNNQEDLEIEINDYNDAAHQELIRHAIELRKRKGLHSEFWYKLDELVDKIKVYKERTTIVPQPEEVEEEKTIKKKNSLNNTANEKLPSTKRIAFWKK